MAMNDEASYICGSCDEVIVIPLDLTAGASQEYVVDCPVCCHPNVVHVEVGKVGDVRVWVAGE
jgi:Cysteine-rich CPXCG